jgi:hypothetical protein
MVVVEKLAFFVYEEFYVWCPIKSPGSISHLFYNTCDAIAEQAERWYSKQYCTESYSSWQIVVEEINILFMGMLGVL